MVNTKLNVYKVVFQKVCEKISGAEEYIEKRIEDAGKASLVQDY